MAKKVRRYVVGIGLAVLAAAAVFVLSVIDWPTEEEKAIRQMAVEYCQAIQSAETLGDAWELTDKNYDEAEFHVVSMEGIRKEKVGPAEINGDAALVGVTRYYDNGEKKIGYIFFKKVDGEWKIELPGK